MEFKKLALNCIEQLRPYFSDNQCRICDCTVGGTFMWRDHHGTEYAIEDGLLYLKTTFPEISFAPPRGPKSGRGSYDRIIEYCAGNGLKARLCSVSDAALEEILGIFPGAEAISDRACSDYLYRSEDIISLAGRKYSTQRNHINRFLKENPAWSFEPITADNLDGARAFFEKYAREHIKDYPAYTEGNRKALEVLDNMCAYGQFGGLLIVNGGIIGASLAEIMGDTMYIHVEKADASYHGSYPMLMNRFAKTFAADGAAFINREEDDGVEGLRKSKLSYHPVELLDKYTVVLG